MSEQEIEVSVNSSHDPMNEEPSRDETPPGVEHASDTLIDASIATGVAAERANDSAGDAEVSALEANLSAAVSRETADRVESQQDRLAAVAADLRATSENLAAVAAASTATTTGELEEPMADPTIDVAPNSEHWLTKKWNFGFGNKKERIE